RRPPRFSRDWSSDVCSSDLFFDPDLADRSPGTFIILWHVRQAVLRNLPYVYLGYWIAESRKMAYKAKFRPIEILTPRGWTDLPRAEERRVGKECADGGEGGA